MTASEAAKTLGISARQVYALAAPGGPIPCTRICNALCAVGTYSTI